MSTAIDLELALSPTEVAPSPAPAATFWRWHGHQLDPRANSLNLIRLGLASMVLFAHGFYLSGTGVGPHVDGENLGGWAVFGFFAVSGYLITASRWSNSLGTFLVHRVARIFPAFLVCLVVVAVLFAPIGYLRQHGSLAGYLTTGPTTPAGYVFANSMLHINANEIAGTPAGVPFPGAWDGSIWSLYYEFQSYLIVAGLAMIGWVRRNPLGIAVAWILSVGAYVSWGRVAGPLLGGNGDAQLLLKLLPLFLGGALVQLLRERLPLHWTGALISVAVVLGAIKGLDGWSAQLTAPLIAYLLLYIGSVVPCPRLIQRHDISYGVYVYAWPVQQLLVFTGVHQHGVALYDILVLAGTIPFAVASWLVVERPAMRRARRARGPATRDRGPAAPDDRADRVQPT